MQENSTVQCSQFSIVSGKTVLCSTAQCRRTVQYSQFSIVLDRAALCSTAQCRRTVQYSAVNSVLCRIGLYCVVLHSAGELCSTV